MCTLGENARLSTVFRTSGKRGCSIALRFHAGARDHDPVCRVRFYLAVKRRFFIAGGNKADAPLVLLQRY